MSAQSGIDGSAVAASGPPLYLAPLASPALAVRRRGRFVVGLRGMSSTLGRPEPPEPRAPRTGAATPPTAGAEPPAGGRLGGDRGAVVAPRPGVGPRAAPP